MIKVSGTVLCIRRQTTLRDRDELEVSTFAVSRFASNPGFERTTRVAPSYRATVKYNSHGVLVT